MNTALTRIAGCSLLAVSLALGGGCSAPIDGASDEEGTAADEEVATSEDALCSTRRVYDQGPLTPGIAIANYSSTMYVYRICSMRHGGDLVPGSHRFSAVRGTYTNSALCRTCQ